MDDDVTFEPRMSPADALMWAIEKDPLLRSTITTVTVLDRAPDRDRLRRRVDRVSRVVPRLRQRVRGHPYSIAPPRWETDPNFDLSYHLRWVRAAGAGTLREVFDLAEPIAMQGFDRARPLWEFVVVEGLEDDRAALITKVHHSITDGVGGVKMQMELLDLERDPAEEPPMPDAPEVRVLSEAERIGAALTHEVGRGARATQGAIGSLVRGLNRATGDPVGAGLEVAGTAASIARVLSPATQPLSPLMRGRSLSVRFDTLTLSLSEAKAAARVSGGKLNDAFVAGIAGGMSRYHRHHGVDPEALRMSMPINIRSADSAGRAGNQFAPARFPVPIRIDDPLALMTAVREVLAAAKAEPALALTEPLAGILTRLPTSASTSLFGALLRGIDVVTSNVPGAPIPVYLGGGMVETQIPFGPMAGAAANITLLSYQDALNIGVNTDPAAIGDPDVFLSCLSDSFDEILKLG